MYPKIFKILLIFTIIALVLSACRPTPPQPTSQPLTTEETPVEKPPTVPPTSTKSDLTVIDDGSPLPPQVVGQQPNGAEELATGGVIRLVFDQAMDTSRTGAVFQVDSEAGKNIKGKVSWPDERTLEFKPSDPLETGSLYSASLGDEAASAQGVAMVEPYRFQFLTAGDLEVTQVFPSDGAKGVTSSAVITVIFNRPVVPLGIAEEEANLSNPLSLSPQVAGKGEWVSTSVYAFRPETTLKGGVSYTATIKAGLADATGESTLVEE